MSFKYDVSVESPTRNQELLNKFKNDLQAVGWKSQDKERNKGRVYCNATTKTDDLQKEHFWECDEFHAGNKIFNIDNEWEAKAALAIASIVDDNESHVGELWKYNNMTSLWHIDSKSGERCTIHSLTDVPKKGFQKAQDYGKISEGLYRQWCKCTPEEIIAYFKPKGELVTREQFLKTTEMKEQGKKIKHYKLKDSAKQFEKAASIIMEGRGDLTHATVGIGGDRYDKLVAAGVLDLWFEPVYEEENKSVAVTIGTPAKSATIMQDGKILVDKLEFTMEDVRKLQVFFTKNGGAIGEKSNYSLTINTVWIGCRSEGTAVTAKDVDEIISEYNKLQP